MTPVAPIANHKQICRDLAPAGWAYGGFDEGRYLFQTGSYATGFKLMECLEEDLTRENLAFMAKHGLTRMAIQPEDEDEPDAVRQRQRARG
jgi:hypothetical protein